MNAGMLRTNAKEIKNFFKMPGNAHPYFFRHGSEGVQANASKGLGNLVYEEGFGSGLLY